VETKESPLSKVIVSMPLITAALEEREYEAMFVARVENAANLLVGNYNIVEHNAYQGLRYGRLNRIFELVGVLCQPRPEPIMQKHKSAATGVALEPRKTFRKRGRGRRSSHSVTQTSAQELALAKPLKRSTKMTSTSAAGSGATCAPKCGLNLFDSSSSASEDGTAPKTFRGCIKSLVTQGIFE
jgi:hypothetical protein